MQVRASLIVALALIAGLGTLASQTPSEQRPHWPPPPARIVNEVGERSFTKGQTQADVYSVPEDQWFILTEFRRIHTSALDPELDLMMRVSGREEEVLVVPYRFTETDFTTGFGSVLGLKFPPSSTVVLRRNERSSATQKSQYLLVGYLVPE